MNLHDEALQLLLYTLEDDKEALTYCEENYDVNDKVYLILLQKYI